MYGRDRLFNKVNIFDPIISAKVFEEGFVPHYPDNKKFAACISHDIDFLFAREGIFSKGLNATKKLVKGELALCNYYLQSIVKRKVFPDLSLNTLVQLNKLCSI